MNKQNKTEVINKVEKHRIELGITVGIIISIGIAQAVENNLLPGAILIIFGIMLYVALYSIISNKL